MKVLLAEEMGMCFGVRDALKATTEVEDPSSVAIHGHLVHNEVVLQQLGARGFSMSSESDRRSLPDSPRMLITAHGISDRERARLQSAGKELIDTTCPLVRRVHETAQRLHAEGWHIVLIGKPNHVEVRGIVEDLERFDVVEMPADAREFASRKLAIICQTTVAPRTVAAVRSAIAEKNPEAEIRFVDTTCQPTRLRQHAVEDLLPRVQAMVVVGGRNSNNTRELVDLCREHGMLAHQVCDARDLRREWFVGIHTVGLTAGTSTLDETVGDVERWLRNCRTENEAAA